ncbi:hypothetical protein BDA96_01G211600 [Sorghum bicolor]|uniref:Pectinesterase inhibitor domain-containing protein n=1 Tax=Sorghum bicolor TaxID=4558 RepID=A0A921S064_SORBI|nr:hypothetical protein BDA96_01G211600 [Sorghum bicolor]
MALARTASSSLLLLLVLSCWCGATTARPAPTSDAAGAGFVKSWCAGTEYPALCDATLASYAAEVGTSAARLSWAALTVTLDGARDATAAMKGMAAAGHLAPVAAEAARDCVSMLGDAVDMLRQSVETMARLGEEEEEKQQGQPGSSSRRNVRFQVDSVQTWASAALTDDDMCMEGFKGEAAVVREAVRGHVVGVAHLTANALAIVNAMGKSMGVDICRGSCKSTPTPPPATAP